MEVEERIQHILNNYKVRSVDPSNLKKELIKLVKDQTEIRNIIALPYNIPMNKIRGYAQDFSDALKEVFDRYIKE